jgi:L-asparaginase
MRRHMIATVAALSFAAPAVIAQNSADTALPDVLVLATGGTIAGKASGTSAIGYDAGQVSGDDLIAAVPGIEKIADLSTDQVSNIGSQDMNDKVWIDLANRIEQAFRSGEADGIVITHGTDTIEETAFFLEQVLSTDKPVVLTAAMRPSTAISADGPANIYEAVMVAGHQGAKGRGVLMVINDTIYESRDVQKTNTTSLQTFEAPNTGPVGYVDPASVRFLEPVVKYQRPRFSIPDKAPMPRVDIIYAHANMTDDQINESVKGGAKALVIAGVGDGNTSKEAQDALVKHAKNGIIVVRSTRVGSGFTNRNAEVNDDELGFAASLDLSPQKARILMQLLLLKGVTDINQVQKELAIR